MGNDSVALSYLTSDINVTCFVDAALYQNATSTPDVFNNEALEAIASDCALPTLPFIPRDLNLAFTVFVIAVLGCGQQYCLIAALQTEAPSKVTMVRSLNVIFTFMFEAVASAVSPVNKMPRIENWLGAAIVFVAIMIVASNDLRSKISNAYKRLFCIKESEQEESVKGKSAEGDNKEADAGAGLRNGDAERGADDNGDLKKEEEKEKEKENTPRI